MWQGGKGKAPWATAAQKRADAEEAQRRAAVEEAYRGYDPGVVVRMADVYEEQITEELGYDPFAEDPDFWAKVQEEFRGVPQWQRFFGVSRRTCAWLNPGELKVWHDRQCEVLQTWAHVGLRALAGTWAVGGLIGGLVAMAFAVALSGMDWTYWRTWAYIVIGVLGSGGLGFLFGSAIAAWRRYKDVFDDVSVLGVMQSAIAEVLVEGRTVMPHLAFVNEPNYFSDGENIILVAYLPGEDPREMVFTELYNLSPARPDWSGVAARAIDSRMGLVRSAAARRRMSRTKKRNLATAKNVLMLLFGLLALGGLFNIISMQSSEPPIDLRKVAGGGSDVVTGVEPTPTLEPDIVPTPGRRGVSP